MKFDRMAQAWLALAGALALLLGLEAARGLFPGWAAGFKGTHFLDPNAGAPEPVEEKGEVLLPGLERLPAQAAVPSHSSPLQVRRLFKELEKGKRKRLRIAYFADSITEGDVITENLRSELQKAYGGLGPGFQPMAPRDAGFRDSLILSPSKEWQRFDLHDQKEDPGIPLAICGEAYRIEQSSPRASLRLEQAQRRPAPWYERATLFWGPGPATLLSGSARFELQGKGEFNSFRLPGPPRQRLDLGFSGPPGAWFYGVSLDSPRGVGLDNFTFRGNGGDGPSRIAPDMLKAAQAKLHYDLVMLHFGLNALKPGEKDFHWYRVTMRRSLEHLKANLPGAKFVVVSVMDHAYKLDGAVVSDPSLPYVLAAQAAAAADAGVWFINLYEMMGGAGLMRRWAEATPPLANKDYTHPNRRGGARLAQYLRAALLGLPNPAAQEAHATAP